MMLDKRVWTQLDLDQLDPSVNANFIQKILFSDFGLKVVVKNLLFLF